MPVIGSSLSFLLPSICAIPALIGGELLYYLVSDGMLLVLSLFDSLPLVLF